MMECMFGIKSRMIIIRGAERYGARPSPGAARWKSSRRRKQPHARGKSDAAAPEDGRAPMTNMHMNEACPMVGYQKHEE